MTPSSYPFCPCAFLPLNPSCPHATRTEYGKVAHLGDFFRQRLPRPAAAWTGGSEGRIEIACGVDQLRRTQTMKRTCIVDGIEACFYRGLTNERAGIKQPWMKAFL